jgi:hypothetical protein
MDGSFPVGRPSLLFFSEEVYNNYNIFHTVLGAINAGDKSFSVLEKSATECLILFADGGFIAIGVHLAPSFFTEGHRCGRSYCFYRGHFR